MKSNYDDSLGQTKLSKLLFLFGYKMKIADVQKCLMNTHLPNLLVARFITNDGFSFTSFADSWVYVYSVRLHIHYVYSL